MNSANIEQHMLQRLVSEVNTHPHKDELIEIMYQQVQDEQDDLGIIA